MRETIQIIDAQIRTPVDAEIFDEVALTHFIETQAEWRPVILAAARALSQQPNQGLLIPRHFHWDWTRKEAELKLLAVKFYGLACEGKLQGIMKVETVAHSCRLPEQQGKPLVYIDYIESHSHQNDCSQRRGAEQNPENRPSLGLGKYSESPLD